jgi:serine/threonine-protein kinase
MTRSLEQIVDEAQTLPPGERQRFIRDACASDEVLYASVVQQLESRQFDGGLEDDQAQGEIPDPAGQVIGAYRIVRSLGQGGMGEVFLAERADDQFRQQVAIKLVRRGLLSRHVQGRLKQERQILASLDHPNIARLYDGGTTAEGLPYIVMEYVEGEPIDLYCDRRRLTVEERLRLFMKVCGAVHRAHQNLIVHRDLKPSNILVTKDGTPKLLDFGIAKLLDERDMTHTLAMTQADVRVMTPDHASPEQIRGELISTASDIYVLGVLLYELLSGHKPFILRGKGLAELEQTICEEPPRPLTAPAGSGDDSTMLAERIAEERSVGPAKLRRQLRGDLDNIVMMAMRKEPERRYSSVEQLAADVERYLNGMPVLARPDEWSYRASKFVRRHAVVVTLSAAFALLLVGFSVTVYLQSTRIARERDAAQAQYQRAETERQRAETASSFLIDAFTAADPFSAGGSITAKQILDNSAARIDELRSERELQAAVLDTIGSAYLGLGLVESAHPLIEQSLAIRRERYGPDSLEVAQGLYSLDRVYEKKGDLNTAEALARESLAITQRGTGEDSPQTARSLCRLGVIQRGRGELAEAEKLFERCLAIRTRHPGENDELLTIPLDNLARIARERSDYARAEQLLRQALDIDRRTRDGQHPQYARHLIRLASVLQDKGDTAAEQLYRESIDLHRRVLGPEHVETIDATSFLGQFLLQTGRVDEAEQVLNEVMQLNRAKRGPRHPYVAADLENLGRLAFRRGRFAEAERLFKEALSIYQEALQPGHGMIASTLTILGRTQLALDQRQAAEATLKSAVESWRLQYGERSPGYAMARASLGRALTLQSRYRDAEPMLLEGYPVLAKSTRPADRDSASVVRGWIEDLYGRMGRPGAARTYFQEVEAARLQPADRP